MKVESPSAQGFTIPSWTCPAEQLQGEWIADVRLAPIDELTMSVTGKDVAAIHILMQDRVGEIEFLQTVAYVVKSIADLLLRVVLRAKRQVTTQTATQLSLTVNCKTGKLFILWC